VEKGEEIQISRGDTPVAKLVPLDKRRGSPRPKVGTVTSPGIKYRKDAWSPLTAAEMKKWGFS